MSVILGIWQMSPIFWTEVGNDARVFYASARVASHGGNPYDFPQVSAEAQKINDEARAAGTGRDSLGANEYHYPPVMTLAWRVLAPAGDVWFFVLNSLLLLVVGVVAFEMALAALGWRGRWLLRLFFVFSLPMLTVVGSGNPATLLLLGWAAALLALTRNRPVLAGGLLAIGWIKPPVGIVMAAALALAALGPWRRLLAGFALGTLVFAAVNLAAGGIDGTSAWVQSLLTFSQTIDVRQAEVVQQRFLAGLSAPFLFVGPVAASAIAFGLVALVGLWTYRSGALSDLMSHRRLVRLGLLVAAALAVSPYLHTYDLVLEAVPVLLIASMAPTLISRTVLLLWALAPALNLATVLTVVALTGHRDTTWSFAVVLTGLTLVALAVAAVRQDQTRAVGEAAIA